MPSGYPTSRKEAAKELRAAGATPLSDFKGVKKRWKSRCNICESIIFPRLAEIRNGHRPCNFCAKKAAAETRRVPEAQAVREMKIKGLEPLVPYPGAGRPWRSKCAQCGRINSPRLASIRRGHQGCHSCANRGRPMVDAKTAWRVMVKQGKVRPLCQYPGNNKPWRSRCLKCAAEVTPTYSSVASMGRGGCRFCGAKRRATTRTTPESRAREILIAGGATPLEPFVGTKTPWKSRCNACSAVVYPQLGNVLQGAGPCKHCAKYGFNYRNPAVVYLLHHKMEDAYKVGVAGIGTGRIEMLMNLGWRVLATRRTRTGSKAAKIENSVLAQLISSGAKPNAVPKSRMPRGGHTETFGRGTLTVTTIIRMFNSVGR